MSSICSSSRSNSADVIVIGKTDLVDSARVELLRETIRRLNPDAQIVEASKGVVPLDRVLGTSLFDLDRARSMPGWAKELAGEHVPESEEYGFTSFVASRCIRNASPISSPPRCPLSFA